MSVKVYKVAVPAILLKNGKMAKYGQEVRADQIDNPETRHDEGYIKFKSDFDKENDIEEKKEAENDGVKKIEIIADLEDEIDDKKDGEAAHDSKNTGNQPVKKLIK
jgi:hypothetical protein